VTLTQADAVGDTSTTSRTVTISAAPPPPCLVPKIVGKTLAKAKTALRKRHCRAGKVTVTRAYSKRVRKGKVLAQKPKAGKKLKNGAKVSLVLSRGKRR
jgi:beta-lactam-binding protein with PASTA domain